MGNRLKNTKKLKRAQKESQKPKSLIDIIILLAYGYVAIIIPTLKAHDSNGPKFLAIAILNLLVLSYLLYKNKNYSEYSLFQFFKTKLGLVYSLLIILSLLSFVKAISISESIVPFCKMLTTFTATIIVTTILLRDKNYFKYLAIGIAALLVFDSLRVFYDTHKYINGEISRIALVKAGYSNKNILAAALFIKLVFGLWLFSFQKGWLKKFGLLSIFMGSIAVLFMSARAFYMGLIFLSIAYIIYLIISFIQKKDRRQLKNAAVYITSIFAAFLVFTAIQNTFYPENQKGHSKTVAGRLATVTAKDGGGGRLQNWHFTTEMIKKNPLLGIGIGNWKIHIVEKENSYRGDFNSFYKVHNDFLEVASESGIIAGLLYISLFILVLYYFVIILFKKKSNADLKLFFIPAFGMFAYSFDAFFNFPHDRPEIQSLFAIFLGIGVASSILTKDKEVSKESSILNSNKQTLKIVSPKTEKLIHFCIIGISLIITYFLLLNYKMLKVQKIWYSERQTGKTLVNSNYYINNFPNIPVLGADGAEPVKMMIIKKLQQEKNYEKMLKYLHSEYPNPYDSKVEFFLAMAHLELNNQDSALYYMDKAHHEKPFAFLYAQQYCNMLEKAGNRDEAIKVLDDFTTRVKNEKNAWIYSAELNHKEENFEKAAEVIDSALVYFPNDKTLIQLKNYYTANP